MSGKFNAQDARDLMRGKTPEYHVDLILEQVKVAAHEGKDRIKTYACDFGSGNLYGGTPTPLQQAVMDQLHALGFKTAIRCEERQFVDIWLEVSWGETP
jgi:hypothetical protein